MEERFRRLEKALAAIEQFLSLLKQHIRVPPTGNWSWKIPDPPKK